jgi:SAM-dependent methyltransferase
MAAGVTFPFGTEWAGRRFDYLRCASCGASYVDPVPTPAEFERMYDRSTYHDTFYEEVAEEAAASFLPRVGRYLKPGGRLLDFGCGNGSFMRAATRQGFVCDGVELEEKARRQAAANSGCEVFSLDAVKASGRRYDIVYMGDVLEHLPAPGAMLRELEGLLSPGGVFFVEGPLEDNASLVYYAARLFGASKKLRGKRLSGEGPPFHMFRVSAGTQRAFFETLGFELRAFVTDESGWPYLNTGDHLLRPRSAGHFVKMAIGALGVGLARAGNALGLKLGNRFAAIFAQKPSHPLGG